MQLRLNEAPEYALQEVERLTPSKWVLWGCKRISTLTGQPLQTLQQLTGEIKAIVINDDAKKIYETNQVDLNGAVTKQINQLHVIITKYKNMADLPDGFQNALNDLEVRYRNEGQPAPVAMEVDESRGGNDYQSFM